MQRENVYLEFGNSPETPNSEDMDFHDVFGGPPRRFSMQEVKARYSFGETVEPEEASSRSERPVFGEETTPRRRRHGGDFFDDIFKGGGAETYSSPRRSDGLFGSNPGSRIMSPSRPLPPKSDPFATSLPTQFSLSKGTELPTFGSPNHVQYGSTNGSNSSSPLSRFLGRVEDEVRPVSRQSPLSYKASFIIEDSSSSVTFDPKDSNQFHFSIYKWAGKGGEPMLTPLVIGKAKHDYKESHFSTEEEKKELQKGDGKERSQKAESVKSQVKKPLHAEEETKKLQKAKSLNEKSAVRERILKAESVKTQVKKPLHPGNLTETKDKKTKSPPGKEVKNVKEKGVERLDSKNTEVRKSRAKGSGVGMVKEFVQIFNQEVDSDQNRNSREKNEKKENEVRKNAAQDKEQVKLHDSDKKPDVSFKVDAKLNNEETQQYSAAPQKIFSSETDSKHSVENSDDPLEDNFQVEELSDSHENVTPSESSEAEDTKAIDAKIRQWSVGKKGNIRSLLSTLQYVLWAESGWKAVPLMDLIEANAVKKAYQKALLRLHPDKLQQKGAAFHHKYIAEKVFDILQEAWDHFNTSSITM